LRRPEAVPREDCLPYRQLPQSRAPAAWLAVPQLCQRGALHREALSARRDVAHGATRPGAFISRPTARARRCQLDTAFMNDNSIFDNTVVVCRAVPPPGVRPMQKGTP
jgi:hypothetical protein